jgi:hypothetical protein
MASFPSSNRRVLLDRDFMVTSCQNFIQRLSAVAFVLGDGRIGSADIKKTRLFSRSAGFLKQKSREPLLRKPTKLLTALNIFLSLFRVVNKLQTVGHHHQHLRIIFFPSHPTHLNILHRIYLFIRPVKIFQLPKTSGFVKHLFTGRRKNTFKAQTCVLCGINLCFPYQLSIS